MCIFGFNSANAEGWALYAEQLAAENGWYENDVKGRIGQLEGRTVSRPPARRGHRDPCLRWTREQAIEYGIPAGGGGPLRGPARPSLLLQGWPTEKSSNCGNGPKKSSARKFETREFHNTMLRAGNVPLPVLESIVDDWTTVVKAARPR